MAYNKVSNKTQEKDVKYLSKDYNSFKNQLMDFAEVYFPNNFKVLDISGMVFNPISREWNINKNFKRINYFFTAKLY